MACCDRLEISLKKVKINNLTDGFLFFEGKDEILVTAESHGEFVVEPRSAYEPKEEVSLDTGESWPTAGQGPVLITLKPNHNCLLNVKSVIVVWELDLENIQSALTATSKIAINWAGTLASAVLPNPGGLLDSLVNLARGVADEILKLFNLSNDRMMTFFFNFNDSMDSTVSLLAWDWGTDWDPGYPKLLDPANTNKLELRKTQKAHGGEWEVTFLVTRICVGGAAAGVVPED